MGRLVHRALQWGAGVARRLRRLRPARLSKSAGPLPAAPVLDPTACDAEAELEAEAEAEAKATAAAAAEAAEVRKQAEATVAMAAEVRTQAKALLDAKKAAEAAVEAATPAMHATPSSRAPEVDDVDSDTILAMEDDAILTMDFAPEYVASILNGKKRATTRWLGKGAPIWRLEVAETRLGAVRPGSRLRATCVRCTADAGSRVIRDASGDGVAFAQLLVSRVEAQRVDMLDDNLGRNLEGFVDGAAGLRRALRRFYPGLADEDEVSVIHFEFDPSDEALRENDFY